MGRNLESDAEMFNHAVPPGGAWWIGDAMDFDVPPSLSREQWEQLHSHIIRVCESEPTPIDTDFSIQDVKTSLNKAFAVIEEIDRRAGRPVNPFFAQRII